MYLILSLWLQWLSLSISPPPSLQSSKVKNVLVCTIWDKMSENSLAGVRANFQCIAERGWFLPRSSGEEQVRTFLCSKKGGALGYRRAAVLGLISYHSNKLHILLTKRSENISFNGESELIINTLLLMS